MYDVFDPTSLSDEELYDRIIKARGLVSTYMQSGYIAMAHSIEMTLAVMDEEREYRMFQQRERQAEEAKRRTIRNPNETYVEKSPHITLGKIEGVDK